MAQLPTDSSHLSEHDLLIERYAGVVEGQFAAESTLKEFFPMIGMSGTDTVVNRRLGGTELIALTPGVRPEAQGRALGTVKLTVDTTVLARDSQSMLNKVQEDFNLLSEIGNDHGLTIAKSVDQSFIINVIKGSQLAAPTAAGGFGGQTQADRDANMRLNFGSGQNVQLASAGDEDDPDLLYDAIETIIINMKEKDISTRDMVVVVRPTQFSILLKNNKLVNTDFSEAGADYAKRVLYWIAGVRIVESPRIPTETINGHLLSNASNGFAYDVDETDAKAVAVIMSPKSLLAAEAIPLQSDIWWNKEEKVHFLDSWLAYGVTPNRPDVCGCVFRF